MSFSLIQFQRKADGEPKTVKKKKLEEPKIPETEPTQKKVLSLRILLLTAQSEKQKPNLQKLPKNRKRTKQLQKRLQNPRYLHIFSAIKRFSAKSRNSSRSDRFKIIL
jgi:hypothetical protein